MTVARELEERNLLHVQLAGDPSHRGLAQLVEGHSLQRLLGEFGHGRVQPHAGWPPLAGFADGIALEARLQPQHGLGVEL